MLVICLAACRQEGAPSRVVKDAHNADTAIVRRLVRTSLDIYMTYPDSSGMLADSAYRLSLAVKDTWSMGMSLYRKADIAFDTNNFPLAKTLFEQSQAYLLAVDSFENAALATNGIANVYLQTGPPDSAVKHLIQALEQYRKAGNTDHLAYTYNSLSIAFTYLGQDNKSLEYLEQAIRLFRNMKDSLNISVSLINLSLVLEGRKRYEETRVLLQEAIAISDATNDVWTQFYGRVRLGEIFTSWEKYDSAHLMHMAALRFSGNKIVQKMDLCQAYSAIARNYFLTRDYKLSREYYMKAVSLHAESGNLSMMANQYREITKLNMMLGLKEESIAAYDLYNKYRDSLQKKESATTVNDLETKYRTAEKDLALAGQERDLARQQLGIRNRNAGILALSGVVLILITGGAVFLTHVRQKQQLAAQKAELVKVHAAMKAEEKERARIARNLHDGAGSILSGVKLYLGSLGSQYTDLATSTAYRDTLGLLNDAVAEIRETSHNLMPKTLHQEGLHTAIRDYCHKIGRSEALTVGFQSIGEPARFETDFELMVFRTVQELLNNVIKHAEASQVIVQLTFRPGWFCMTVEDDGKGFGEEGSGDGIGMFAIRDRVEAFRGTMEVESSPEGTSITLEFPATITEHA